MHTTWLYLKQIYRRIFHIRVMDLLIADDDDDVDGDEEGACLHMQLLST